VLRRDSRKSETYHDNINLYSLYTAEKMYLGMTPNPLKRDRSISEARQMKQH
jgi:hypothetical protein